MPFTADCFYADHNAGAANTPLVFVHGAGGSHLDWPPPLRRLADRRVIVPDLPGHGRSPGPGLTSVPAYAAALTRLLDALALPAVLIAGHSMGGAIAQQIAVDQPERVAGLILLGTGSKLPVDPTLPERALADPEATARWVQDWAWYPTIPPEIKALGLERMLAVPPTVIQGDYAACQAFDLRNCLEQISAPTLVIGAQDDRMVPPKFSVTLAERIPQATLALLENAGHMFPQEQPDAVTTAITNWILERKL